MFPYAAEEQVIKSHVNASDIFGIVKKKLIKKTDKMIKLRLS